MSELIDGYPFGRAVGRGCTTLSEGVRSGVLRALAKISWATDGGWRKRFRDEAVKKIVF
jgi:hypothetical protein